METLALHMSSLVEWSKRVFTKWARSAAGQHFYDLLLVGISVNGVASVCFLDRAESRWPVHLTGARVNG